MVAAYENSLTRKIFSARKFPDLRYLVVLISISSDLSEPADVYSDWIDACEAANNWQNNSQSNDHDIHLSSL